MLVVVLSNGGIERRTFELTADVTDEQVAEAQAIIAPALIESDPNPVVSSGDNAVDQLVGDAIAGFASTDTASRVHVGGRSSVAGVFNETETVAQVFPFCSSSNDSCWSSRCYATSSTEGLSVAIGAETGVQNLNECSVVVAPYQVEGTDVGSIGVVGPTHMNYPQALAAVAVISTQLGEHLTRG